MSRRVILVHGSRHHNSTVHLTEILYITCYLLVGIYLEDV